MNKTERLGKEKITKLLVSLAVPSIISLLMNSLNVAIDRIFVGTKFGTAGMSAVTVAFGIYLLMQALSQLVSVGASAGIAIELGNRNSKAAGQVLGNAITMSAVLSVVMMAVGTIFLKPLLMIYGANQEIIADAVSYARVLVLGSATLIFAQTLNGMIRSMGYSKRAMINFTADITGNIIMDALFIFVFQFGIQGAAIATILSNCICIVMAILFLISNSNPVHVTKHDFVLTTGRIKEMFCIGVSSCIMQIALSINTIVYDQISLKYGGTICIAVYGVLSTLTTMMYMPMIGLLQGMQPIIGYNLGAGDITRVRETLHKGIKTGVIFAFLFGTVLFVFADQILKLFGGGADAMFMHIGRVGLRITVSTFPLAAVILIMSNYFQYVKKPKQSLVLTLLSRVLLIYPLIIILPMIFGFNGVFYAGFISDLISFVLAIILLTREEKMLSLQIDGLCYDGVNI